MYELNAICVYQTILQTRHCKIAPTLRLKTYRGADKWELGKSIVCKYLCLDIL